MGVASQQVPEGLLVSLSKFFLLPADVDECAEGLAPCGAHAQCVNLPGSHRCQCQSGYELGFDGRTCVGESPRAFSENYAEEAKNPALFFKPPTQDSKIVFLPISFLRV